MPYKTILVHLNDKRHAEGVLEPAVQLASRHNCPSHRHACLLQCAGATDPDPLRSEVLGSIVAAERQENEEIAAMFARMTANQPFVAEWRAEKGPHIDPLPS